MFEQPLYEFEPAATPPQGDDLFKDYELKSWIFTPKVIRIVALAAVVNIVAILVVAQTSLLTLKGCDSPLVGSVCQVLDTVYVGALLFGTDREVVDVAYDKTELGEDDEITYIDVSNIQPPFKYPGDYFRVANPEQFMVPEEIIDDLGFTQNIPGIPNGLQFSESQGGNSLFDTPQKLPTANPNILESETYAGNSYNNGGSYSMGGTTPKPPRNIRPKTRFTPPPEDPNLGPDGDETAKLETPTPTPVQTFAPTPTPSGDVDVKDDVNGVAINGRPAREMAVDTIKKVESRQIRLDTNFKVGISGTLGLAKDGKTVVLKNAKAIPPDTGVRNDPAMEKFVQEWILKGVGDSGWLGYIEILDKQKKIKDKRVTIMLEQTDTKFFATINAELPDENIAKLFASGLNYLIGLGANNTDGDEQQFLKALTPTYKGNSLIMNMELPKPIVQEMFIRNLAKQKAQLTPTSGNASSTTSANTAEKN